MHVKQMNDTAVKTAIALAPCNDAPHSKITYMPASNDADRAARRPMLHPAKLTSFLACIGCIE